MCHQVRAVPLVGPGATVGQTHRLATLRRHHGGLRDGREPTLEAAALLGSRALEGHGLFQLSRCMSSLVYLWGF